MVQKRPFDQELQELSSKQPRHVEPSDQLASLGVSQEPIALKSHSSGEGEDTPLKSQFTREEKFDSACAADVRSSERDIEPGIPGSASNSSWATSSTSEEDVKSEGPYHILVSPEHYNLDLPSFRNVSRSKLIYSSLMRSPPRKLVPIGPDYQADLPDFVGHEKKKTCYLEETCKADITSQALESDSNGDLNDDDRLAGTSIIPMPKLESSGYNDESVGTGSGSGDCLCEDAGSIRCTRQHVFEAREKLKTVLGEETFVKLGFYDIGEVVALRWSEEEQELFHDIVFSNPASVGKNFWNHLSAEFPSRTMKQIVSYYFNVFMLRRRAEQNRFDPLNVDSDNDEWQAPEESSGDEAKMTDEDEDSVVESPVYLDDYGRNEIYRYDDIGLPVWEEYKDISNETNKAVNYESVGCADKAFEKCSSEPTARNEDRDFPNGFGDENGNCTTVTPKAPHVKSDIGKDWSRSFVGMGSDNGHDFVLEPCSGKEWDVGFFSCPKSKVDLLPTCTMIEEVFGDKDWNYSSRGDGHGSS
nr:uncharacterized protein LOC109149738 [Ipomoea trifida]